MGRILTLITKDVFAFEKALTFVNDMWIGLIHIGIVSYLIYRRIGITVAAGIGFLLMIIPLQIYVGKKTSMMRMKSAKSTDERIQLTTETLSAIKIVKMYSWELFFENKINDVRSKELKKLAPVYYLKCIVLIIGSLASNLSFALIILTYIWTGHYTNAGTVFFIEALFRNIKSFIIASIPLGISNISEVYASLNRLNEFLNSKEVASPPRGIAQPKVYLNHVSAKVKDSEVLTDVSLSVEKGLYLVTGSVGSGKSSLLRTILGECTVASGQLAVDGSISYTAEDPWLFPSTIRQNILFGQEYDEKRYNEVLRVCALKEDLSKFENGDQTIVGDKGVNLSKGQQTRINLARAVYRNSDIYLLDDCLSHLDSHVNLYVFRKCIMEFLKTKIVILVTTNINHIKLVYGHNLLFMKNGITLSLEEQQETLEKRVTYYMDDTDNSYFEEERDQEVENEIHDVVSEEAELLPVKKSVGDNLYHEEKRSGKVNIGVYMKYYRFAGGFFPLLLVLVVFVTCQFAAGLSEKKLSEWVNIEPTITDLVRANETNSTIFSETISKRNHYLNLYAVLILTSVVLTFARTYLTFFFSMKASKNLHDWITHSVLNSFMTFFDGHYIGNIINRFSKDVGTIDETIPLIVYEIMRGTLQVLSIMFLLVSAHLIFLLPVVILIILLYFLRRFYISTGRNIKRLDASTRSPFIGHFNATMEGLTTVRAYEKEPLLIEEFDRHLDHHTSAYYMMICTSRAFGFTIDMICSTLLSAVVVHFVFFNPDSPVGSVALAISQANALMGLLQGTVRMYSEIENNMTAIERVLEYSDIETENRKKGLVKDNWPDKGMIEFKDLSLTYTTTKQQVLKGLNFVLQPREKIGIVGRTGAGKSSIISSLFRLYNTEGNIIIDNIDTKMLALEFLRSNIAIIPQDPILFSGTIRSNIDPTERYSDEVIWKAIEKVNIKRLISNLQEKISDHGSNYSSGQRQLICLVRALVSKSKIIVLDEATANMDPETCGLLQSTIKQNFAECTVLTIAHRLNTVSDSDRVMVVDHGQIVEFDTPDALLGNQKGVFYNMFKHSGLLES
ncbi:probable multidrug resistance-associated protein lethal(2)03659 isoform X2 [Leptinotarsa decemlineata]